MDALPGHHGGNEYSVLIAGATGNIGKQIVTLACASPHIHRVVGLTRHDIPSEKWPQIFPNINMQEAQKKLKMVKVDWEELNTNNAELAEHEMKWASKKEGDLDLSTTPNPVPLEQRPDWSRHDIVIQTMGAPNGSDEEIRKVDYDYTRAFIVGAVQCNASAGQVVASAISNVTEGVGGLLSHLSAELGEAVSHVADGATAALSNTSVGVHHFAQVSAAGADPGGFTAYRKHKGLTDVFLQSHFSHHTVRSKAVYRPKWAFLCCSGTPLDTVAAAVLNNAIQQCIKPPPVPQAPQQPQTAPSEPVHGTPETERVLPATYCYEEDKIKDLAAPSGPEQYTV